MKRGSPPTVPVDTFFLLGLHDNERTAVSMFMFALYTMHNELRHNPCHADLRRTIFRVMAEVHMPAQAVRAWEEVFGLRPPAAGAWSQPAAPPRAQAQAARRPVVAVAAPPATVNARQDVPDESIYIPDTASDTHNPIRRVNVYVPDTRTDIHNPYVNRSIYVPDTSSDIFVPDTSSDPLSDL